QADLMTLERNSERVGKKARLGDTDAPKQLELFERCEAHLEQGGPLRMLAFTAAERRLLYPLFLMTLKPVLLAANLGDDALEGRSAKLAELRDYAARTRAQVMHLCADIEAEVVRMDEAERAAFMTVLGLSESGLVRLIHAGFDLLGLQTY